RWSACPPTCRDRRRDSFHESPDRRVETVARTLAEPVTSALDDLVAVRPDAIDGCCAGREDPAIENRIATASGQRRMRGVEGDNVGAGALLYSDARLGKCPVASLKRCVEQCAASRRAGAARQHVAFTMLESLAIFELTELFSDTDQDV